MRSPDACGHSLVYQGRQFFYPAGSFIAEYLAGGRGWDTVLKPIAEALLPEDRPVILDVGANIGASLLQLKLAKPHAQVYCFEPSPRYFSCLHRTVEASEWRDVILEHCGLSSEATSAAMLHENSTTASLAAREYDGHTFLQSRAVSVTTIDDYFREGGPLALIKVDTDGHDFDVLLGGKHVLQRDRPALFFEFDSRLLHKADRGPEAFMKFVFDVGYTVCLPFSNYGDVLSVCQKSDEVLEAARGEAYLDVLAVAKPEQAQALHQLATEIGRNYSLRP